MVRPARSSAGLRPGTSFRAPNQKKTMPSASRRVRTPWAAIQPVIRRSIRSNATDRRCRLSTGAGLGSRTRCRTTEGHARQYRIRPGRRGPIDGTDEPGRSSVTSGDAPPRRRPRWARRRRRPRRRARALGSTDGLDVGTIATATGPANGSVRSTAAVVGDGVGLRGRTRRRHSGLWRARARYGRHTPEPPRSSPAPAGSTRSARPRPSASGRSARA